MSEVAQRDARQFVKRLTREFEAAEALILHGAYRLGRVHLPRVRRLLRVFSDTSVQPKAQLELSRAAWKRFPALLANIHQTLDPPESPNLLLLQLAPTGELVQLIRTRTIGGSRRLPAFSTAVAAVCSILVVVFFVRIFRIAATELPPAISKAAQQLEQYTATLPQQDAVVVFDDLRKPNRLLREVSPPLRYQVFLQSMRRANWSVSDGTSETKLLGYSGRGGAGLKLMVDGGSL
ncbi:MAG: hypothetical protein KDD44_01920, partial [Bdellovibrionales bacterium]|nr:hypothetical protein [Bdellovibrionales bacterium]